MKNLYFAVILILALVLPVFQPVPVHATTVSLSLNGEGSDIDGTYTGAPATYANLNSDDGDTTYLLNSISNFSYHSYTVSTLSATVINSVTVTYSTKVGFASSSVTPYIVISGTKYYGTYVEPTYDGSYHTYSTTWTVNPATSATWTAAAVNGAQYGVRYWGQGGTRISYLNVSADCTLTILPPTITLLAATSVASSSAQLNAIVDSDGGQAADVQFAYDNVTHVNFVDYAYFSTLVSNSYVSGSTALANVTGLLNGMTYYYRAKVVNDNATAYSSELTFITPSGINNPTNATAIPKATAISVSWTKGSGSTHTLIRHSSSAYPSTTSAGTSAYMGTGNSVNITGLTEGTTTFISMWGYAGGIYSENYTTALATTLAYDSASSAVNDIETPTTTVTGTASTTKVEGLPWAQAFADISTASDMPVASIWYLFWFMFGVGLGIILYNRMPGQYNLNVTVAAEALWFGLGVTMGLLYLLIPFILILIALGFIIFGGRH